MLVERRYGAPHEAVYMVPLSLSLYFTGLLYQQ